MRIQCARPPPSPSLPERSRGILSDATRGKNEDEEGFSSGGGEGKTGGESASLSLNYRDTLQIPPRCRHGDRNDGFLDERGRENAPLDSLSLSLYSTLRKSIRCTISGGSMCDKFLRTLQISQTTSTHPASHFRLLSSRKENARARIPACFPNSRRSRSPHVLLSGLFPFFRAKLISRSRATRASTLDTHTSWARFRTRGQHYAHIKRFYPLIIAVDVHDQPRIARSRARNWRVRSISSRVQNRALLTLPTLVSYGSLINRHVCVCRTNSCRRGGGGGVCRMRHTLSDSIKS